MEGRAVQQGEVGFAAELLGHHRCQNIGLVVVGERHDQIRILNIGLHQNFLIKRRTMHDDGVAELFRCGNRPVAIRLDDLYPRLRLQLLDLAGNEVADIAGRSR